MSQALTDAFDAVQAKFLADGRTACMFFGWREKEKHNLHVPRLVWVPGDEGTNLGTAGTNISAGQVFPPVYGTLWQMCTIYISAPADPADPDNERKQWTNTIELRNALHIALTKLMGTANYRVENERYVTDVGRRAQVTIVSVISFLDHLQDGEASGLEQVDGVEADATVVELDVEQEFHVPVP